jgi:copper chaperone CopZ
LADVAAPENAVSGVRRVQLDVTGMSCGMCAARIRNKLNKIDGVHASVDFGTRVATIEASRDVEVSDLCDAVRQAGYGAEQRFAMTADSDDSGIRFGPGPLRRLLMLIFRWMTFR